MLIKSLHPSFIMPTKGTDNAGAFDIYMPEDGVATGASTLFGLGFAAAIPKGYAALLLPRSSIGASCGLELNNTCGLIDADYRGEWKAAIRTKSGIATRWSAGARILQFIVLPVPEISLVLSDTLDSTKRGEGGFGSSGK